MDIRKLALTRMLIILFITVVMIQACSIHQQDRDFKNYLCEVNVDGSGFRILASTQYSMDGYMTPPSYRYKLQYGSNDDVLLYTKDGVQIYDPASRKLEPYFDLDYHPNINLHQNMSIDSSYLNSSINLYRISHSDNALTVFVDSVANYCGLPYSNQISVLQSGNLFKWTLSDDEFHSIVDLPANCTNAFYFSAIDKIVYLTPREFRLCNSLGESDSLLYPLNSSSNDVRAFYPISTDGKFITTNRFDAGEHMILVDAATGSSTDLDQVDFAMSPAEYPLPFQISLNEDRNKLLYFDSTALYLHDLNGGGKQIVLITSEDNYNLRNIHSASINRAGTKIVFLCDLYRHNED